MAALFMPFKFFAGMCLDLRSPLGVTPAALPTSIKKIQEAQLARLYAKDAAALEARKTRKLYEGFASSRRTLLQNQSKRRLRSPCVDFERIWWDRDIQGFSKSGISIWRPAPPPGYVSLGQSLTKCLTDHLCHSAATKADFKEQSACNSAADLAVISPQDLTIPQAFCLVEPRMAALFTQEPNSIECGEVAHLLWTADNAA